ncbi:Cholinesterase [Aphelenchoides fujianensis]|nr:Cholinesterase [Aphelenchoides fujianensis]
MLPLIVLLLSFLSVRGEEVVETRLSNGSPLRGYLIERGPRIVHAYRGIPFARPPVGDLRFQKPQTDLPPWTETLNATKPPPACEQQGPGGNRREAEGFENVTCNIGVDLMGSSSTILPDGRVINHSRSDAELMIFIGHRFGAFGFLDVGAELPDAPYNVGLYDLIEGMKWVKREASNFYGNPDSISTNALRDLASLFHLLLVSPAVDRREVSLEVQMLNNHRPLVQPHFSQDGTMKLLRNTACDLNTAVDRLACLRGKSMEEIWSGSPSQFEFGPQTDGRLLPAESYVELLDNWESREAFGHQRTRPVEDFEPVDEEGRNFYFLRTTFSSDNRTAVETPRMHVGEFFDEAAARFWLVDLAELDKSARPKARVHSLAAFDQKKTADCECENSSRSSWTIALVLMLIVASALLIWNVVHLNAYRREKRTVFPPSYQSIN